MPIADDVSLGVGVRIFHKDLVNLYGCRIDEDTKIGSFVEVQKNVIPLERLEKGVPVRRANPLTHAT